MRRSLDIIVEIAAQPRHDDAETGQGNFLGHDFAHKAKHLTVSDYQSRFGHGIKVLLQVGFLQNDADTFVVEHITDGHHLGQNQTSFGGFGIDGTDQNHHFIRLDNAAKQRHFLVGTFGNRFLQNFNQRSDVVLPLNAEIQNFSTIILLNHSLHDGKKRLLVGLVVDDEERHGQCFQAGNELFFRFFKVVSRDDQNGAVDFLQNLHGFFDALSAQIAHVVDARRVDEHARPNAKDFYAFLDGVGGGARRVAHYGDVLSREEIDKAALAAIPATENADMGFQIFCHLLFVLFFIAKV